VPLNIAGQAESFRPTTVRQDGAVVEFSHRSQTADLTARWQLDPAHPEDAVVTLTLIARQAGWFSIATPTLATLPFSDLAWGMVPGYFQGDKIESDFVRAYAYGHGLPDRPVVVRERAASTRRPCAGAH